MEITAIGWQLVCLSFIASASFLLYRLVLSRKAEDALQAQVASFKAHIDGLDEQFGKLKAAHNALVAEAAKDVTDLRGRMQKMELTKLRAG